MTGERGRRRRGTGPGLPPRRRRGCPEADLWTGRPAVDGRRQPAAALLPAEPVEEDEEDEEDEDVS